MKTKITFKALKRDKVVRKTLSIEHPDYDIIPSEMFNGFEMPSVSIESRVIDYLDSIDKSDIMVKHDWDIILDYYPYKKKVRKNEIEEFIEYMRPYVEMFPSITRPLEAVISESKDILFGHGKSNKTKAREILKMLDMTLLASQGIMDVMVKMLFRHDLEYYNSKELEENERNPRRLCCF